MPASYNSLTSLLSSSGWTPYAVGLLAFVLFSLIPLTLRFLGLKISKIAALKFQISKSNFELKNDNVKDQKGERFLFGFTPVLPVVLSLTMMSLLLIPVATVLRVANEATIALLLLLVLSVCGIATLIYANKKQSLLHKWTENPQNKERSSANVR